MKEVLDYIERMFEMKKYEKQRAKYYISHRVKFWSIISTVVTGIVYATLLLYINRGDAIGENSSYWIYAGRDICLALFTIMLSSVFTCMLIEVRSRNEMYGDAVLRDVVSNPAFNSALHRQAKEDLLHQLEEQVIFRGNGVVADMYDSIKQKVISRRDDNYYFTECHYRIKYEVESNGKIKRSIIKTLKIRSYEESYEAKNLCVLVWTGLASETESLYIEPIVVTGFRKEKEEEFLPVQQDRDRKESIDVCSGYDVERPVVLKNALRLSSKYDTQIVVRYQYETMPDNSMHICRTSAPCKSFLVQATVASQNSDYTLRGAAFGFKDNGRRLSEGASGNSFQISFDDWVFSGDGVVVVLSKPGI